MQNSTEPNIVRYLHHKGAFLGLPVAGNFELTPRCNFNCPMCYVHLNPHEMSLQGRELTADEWISLGQEAKKEGMVFLLLTGGEAVVRDDFIKIFSELKKTGLMVSLNSNGYMLSGDILDYFKKDPPQRINVTLYGASNETYSRLCGARNAYDRVVKNLKALKDSGISVKLNCSITQRNCGDIEGMYKTAELLGLPIKASAYMYPQRRPGVFETAHGNKPDESRLTPEEAAKCTVLCDKIRYSKEEYIKRAKLLLSGTQEAMQQDDCCEGQGGKMMCRAGRTSFWITWSGKMTPCGLLDTPSAYPLEVGFKSAWDKIREETKKIRLPHECEGCRFKNVCNVCAAVCMNETGRFDGKPEYVCRMIEDITELTGSEYRTLERGEENI